MTAIDFTADERSELRVAIRQALGLSDLAVPKKAKGKLLSAHNKLASVDNLQPIALERIALDRDVITDDGMVPLGSVVDGIVDRLDAQLHSERAATEQVAADLDDKMARIGGRR